MADGKLNYNPLYLQVKDVLMRRIVDGIHRPGKLLPSESRLAADFGTSISTIRQALSLLVADGILVKKQGKGTLVSERKVHISFLSWMGETRRGEEILNGVIRKFEEKYPPIAVDIIPTTYPETRTTLTRLISSGRAPDVAQIVSHWTSYFASTGAFHPLEGLLSRENMAFRLPGQDLFGGTFQNQVYSAAWGLCPIALVANRNVMRAAGIDELESPMTLSQFQDCCARVGCITGEAAPSAFGLWYTPGVENDYLSIYTFLQAFNGEFVDDSGNLRLDSPQNVSGFTWVRDFVRRTKIFTSDIFTIRNRFAANRIGFISDGPWIKYLLEESTGEPFEKNFQVLLNPVHANPVSRSWTYNHAMAICAQSRNTLHAARFVEALTGDPELSAWYCSRVGILPPNREILDGPEFRDAFFATYREQLRHAAAIDARNPMFERAMVICVDAVRKILFEGADIRRELAEKEYYLNMLYNDS
jgi:ABC-type glycerol-3-phosphate transport system substrate-binding protein